MEKKTIGGFIAALRKANGMTQKDLAERLNVSDKTISRWERDDGAPDLSAIPVIAEIFGVTCDELLRGERKSPARRTDAPAENEPSSKGEKQRQRILTVSLSKYQTHTFIAIGIAAAGLIAAMVGNFGFLRAYIGFLIGAVFYLASVICQAIFINSAFLSVSDDSLNGTEIGRFKWSVIRLAEWFMGVTVVLLGFSLPLVIFPRDTYVGLSAESWFLYGLIFAALALLAVAVVCYFLNASLLKKEVCALREREEHTYYHNHTLKRECVVGLGVAMAVTLAFQAFGSEMLWATHNLASGTVFHDYESFIEYMEQDVPYDAYERSSYRSGLFTIAEEQAAVPEEQAIAPEREASQGEEAVSESVARQEQAAASEPAVSQIEAAGEGTWYDANGNVVSEEEARTRTLEDKNGTVVCKYIDRNESVTSIRYSPKDGTVLPITVITNGDYRQAGKISELINMVYCLLYPIEIIIAAVYYFKKRER